VLLAIPLTYVNDSGVAVAPLLRRAGIESDRVSVDDAATSENEPATFRLLVIHDDLDLVPGRVKIKSGGGHAGHNGLRSIDRHVKTSKYLRMRIGIGKPPGRQSGADFVLKRPAGADRELLTVAVTEAADGVEALVTDGLEAAMNRVNSTH
jgi:peptidyl-tRNA hydrolase, PTH1 family